MRIGVPFSCAITAPRLSRLNSFAHAHPHMPGSRRQDRYLEACVEQAPSCSLYVHVFSACGVLRGPPSHCDTKQNTCTGVRPPPGSTLSSHPSSLVGCRRKRKTRNKPYEDTCRAATIDNKAAEKGRHRVLGVDPRGGSGAQRNKTAFAVRRRVTE